MPIKKRVQKAAVEAISETNLPSVWIDTISLDVRTDDICLLRFYSQLPEGTYEQSRITVTKKVLTSLIDILSASLDYYPKKKAKKKAAKPKLKKAIQ